MSDGTPKESLPPKSTPRSAVLGTISGNHSKTGTISGLQATGSFDEVMIRSNPSFEDDQGLTRGRAHTDDANVPPTRQRLYSEEDEELRLARAMALAVQQHPNMTPEEIHQLHFGDTQQSEIIELQKRQSDESRKPISFVKGFQESIKVSQKKAKKHIHSIVGTTTTNRPTPPQGRISPVAKAAPARGAVISPVLTSIEETSATTTTKEANSTSAIPAVATSETVKEAWPTLMGKPSSDDSRRSTSPQLSSATLSIETVTESTDDDEAKKEKKKKPSVKSNLGMADEPRVLDDETSIRLSSIVWKRRGGIGKLSFTNAWERRKMVLKGSKLFYFVMAQDLEEGDSVDTKKATWFEQAAQNLEKAKGVWLPAADDPSTPRGYLDLVKENCTVAAASGHSGAPSPFAISIKSKGDTIWKLCFDNHATQMEWLAALTDLVVTASVDAYNQSLLMVADPSQEASIFSAGYMPPPATSGQEAAHRLWMMEPYNVRSSECLGDETEGAEEEVQVESKERTMSAELNGLSTTVSLDDSEEGDQWILHDKEVYVVLATVNVALVLSHSSSTTTEGFWYVLTFCNLGLWLCLAADHKKKPRPGVIPSVTVVPELKQQEEVVEKVVLGVKEIEAKIKPIAGTTTLKILKPTDSPEKDGHIFGAWCTPSGNTLAVRSHGYLSTNMKVPSPGELYDCSHVDIFESPRRHPDMAARVTLPKVQFQGDDAGPKTWHAPDVFIVSVALPTDTPSLRGGGQDGGGYTITMYFTMQQETRDILRRVTADSYDILHEPIPTDIQKSKVNAVKLFEEWCRRAPTDPAFQSRFKLIPNAQNLKEIGMPSWIAKYNGKPVLIKRPGQTGFLFSHPELSCMEFDISLHPFPYLAKQAICYMKENFFEKVVVTFGFCIEGRSDDELPECVIGLMQLCYPDPQYAIQAADFFAGTSPKSF